jgi:hypothetical protein
MHSFLENVNWFNAKPLTKIKKGTFDYAISLLEYLYIQEAFSFETKQPFPVPDWEKSRKEQEIPYHKLLRVTNLLLDTGIIDYTYWMDGNMNRRAFWITNPDIACEIIEQGEDLPEAYISRTMG